METSKNKINNVEIIDLCAICYETKQMHVCFCSHSFCIRCLCKLNKCAICRVKFDREFLQEIKEYKFNKMKYLWVDNPNRKRKRINRRFDGLWYIGY